ncbi:polysaccharide deacetylase family protein [Flaviaesturariibacter aridisoli]|uniref:Polysaccharide deacetylase family protein n=1 Tax=Flaviaesturariibacter aridisoli TaxID=2545761 RepID=A0A4R4E7U4_9BACT|nr:polysaccharide deacetylase family protein [Flaviaesturariibacter aridisoli]TCZ74900.1 polysaccharide deacetylase family protein [Flaviaesturariibacter aridisoli]
MHRYFIKTPWLVKRLFSRYEWDAPAAGNTVYLTFDDGPHPVITPWVLDLLAEHGAKGTFFCIGKNVALHPGVFARITTEGHAVGNHTENHRNGWKTDTRDYLDNVRLAAARISSDLFRPPYGRIRAAQARGLAPAMGRPAPRVIMWDVLSADFDQSITPQECIANVLAHTVPGSIIVFHDSDKAWPNLKETLPVVLRSFREKGFQMKAIGPLSPEGGT